MKELLELSADNRVFFVGDVALDEYFSLSDWPGIAAKADVAQLPTYCGGSIANAACVFAGLGGAAEFVSILNQGETTARLLQDLNESGVSTSHMLFDPGMPDARNLIFLAQDEHVVFTVETEEGPMVLGEDATQALMRPGYLYTTLSRLKRLRPAHDSSDQGYRGFSKAMYVAGRQLVLDLDVHEVTPGDIGDVAGAFVLIMNQTGFHRSFGHDDITEITEWMQIHNVSWVVRTKAANGAEATDGMSVISEPGLKVSVKDVTGAGDTFGASLLYCLTTGKPMADALAFAVAASARAVTIQGPRGGVATQAEIASFIRSNQVALQACVPTGHHGRSQTA